MSRLYLVLFASLIFGSVANAQDQGEHVVVTGSPSLMEWEKYKIQPHDNWWMNFVRASRLRIEQLRAAVWAVSTNYLVGLPAWLPTPSIAGT